MESESLHARVRAFARAGGSDTFEDLALSIARFQASHSPAFTRLVELHGGSLDTVDRIPAVPTDAFRLTRVAVHDASMDVARFVTSGTTESARGTHPFRTTRTYAELSAAFGRAALIHPQKPPLVVALATLPAEPPSSSLSFMFATFMREFGGQSLTEGHFSAAEPGRWLLRPTGIDIQSLRLAIDTAKARSQPLLLLSTSLALLSLLEALEGEFLILPEDSVVMQTGGYKGRHVTVHPAELRTRVSAALGVPEGSVISEYGMTELSSQLYEGTCPGAALSGPPNVYIAPPWLRVTAVDSVSLQPLAPGEVGIARFVDLGNVDSAVAVLTRDRIRALGPGIELLGREPGAPPRGCSLAVEALLGEGR